MGISKMASRIFQAFRGRLPTNSRAYAAVHGASAVAGEHAGGGKRWKLLSLLVAVPGVILCYINADKKEKEHKLHYERPEFVPYSHLRLRSKAFPWGDGNHGIFHNKEINALPEGYED